MRPLPALLSFRPASALLLALLAGCPKPTPVQPVSEGEPAPSAPAATVAIQVTARQAVPGLRSVACDEEGCRWRTASEQARFSPETLEVVEILAKVPLEEPGPVGDTNPSVEAAAMPEQQLDAPPEEPSPEPSAPANPLQAEIEAWQALMSAGESLPFQRRVPVVGGTVSYRRGMDGGGKLSRTGGGFRTIDAPAIAHTVTCEGWLAPHPSGLEAYLLLWPTPELIAYDTRALAPRWSIELPGPAQGLFVDAAGRFAMLALTAAPDEDRLTDYPAASLDAPPGLPADRPEHRRILLLDLASGRIAAEAPGSFVAWLPSPDGGWLLATDQELLRLEPR